MKKEAQRIAIAKMDKWINPHFRDGSAIGRKSEHGDLLFIPDYLNDLNAMHKVEKILRNYPTDEWINFTEKKTYTCRSIFKNAKSLERIK